jgi:hypothetical protein
MAMPSGDGLTCPRCDEPLRLAGLPGGPAPLSYPHGYPGRCPACQAALFAMTGDEGPDVPQVIHLDLALVALRRHARINPAVFDLIPNGWFWVACSTLAMVATVACLAVPALLVTFLVAFVTLLVLGMAIHLATARPLALLDRMAFRYRLARGTKLCRLVPVGRSYRE